VVSRGLGGAVGRKRARGGGPGWGGGGRVSKAEKDGRIVGWRLEGLHSGRLGGRLRGCSGGRLGG